MRRMILPSILALCFYGESLFVDIISPEAFGGPRILVPHFLLVILVIMGIYYFRYQSLIYAAVVGLLFDVYYTEIIGVYLFLFPISVYFTTKLKKVLQANLLSTALIVILNIMLVEILVYLMNLLVLQASTSMNEFALQRLWPTLVLNSAFFILIYFPMSKWLQKRKKEVMDE